MKKNDKIIVLNYNPIWAIQFKELKTVLVKHIGSDSIEIEHVGSTSIPDLSAKPIIDLDIIIEDDQTLMKIVIDKLKELGYIHVGNLGVTGREAFKKTNSKTPDNGTNRDWFQHNLYLCKKGSIGLQNHLFFRDYLKSHPEKIIKYTQLKQNLAEKYPHDIDAYIDGKTDFITKILNKAGMKEEDTRLIDNENRLKI